MFNPQDQSSFRPDAILYERIAFNLSAGNGYTADTAPPYRTEITRSPILPYMAAGLFKVFGQHRQVLLWFQALLVSLSVVITYFLAREILGDWRHAYLGAWLVCLLPQVAGITNAFLTESLGVFQVSLGALLILRWPIWRERRWASLLAAGTGLLLASLVLNRPNFVPLIGIAVAWAGVSLLRIDPRSVRNWVTLGCLCIFLAAPVLGWSARNASLGLPFMPLAAGGGSGYMVEVDQYKKYILDPGESIPQSAGEFWSHFASPMGPEKLKALDAQNMAWVMALFADRWDRYLLATPERLFAIFSDNRVSIYHQPWPPSLSVAGSRAVRLLTVSLWLFAFIGFVLAWRRPTARWVWLAVMGTFIPFSLISNCIPRYAIPLAPLLIPYGAVTVFRIRDRLFGSPVDTGLTQGLRNEH